MFLEVEPHLTISDTKSIEKNFKSLSAKHNTLEAKVDDLLQYLRTNSITIPISIQIIHNWRMIARNGYFSFTFF